MRCAPAAVMSAVLSVSLVPAGCGGTTPPAEEAALPAAEGGTPGGGTVPFTLDHNRIMVDLEVLAPDGRVVPARAWVDTGTEAMILSESLAIELGLDTTALEQRDGDRSVELASACPEVRVGGVALATEGIPLRVYPGASTQRGLAASVHLPAGAFRDLHVVFDYPARRLTVAEPGSTEPVGAPVPCRVSPETSLIMVQATIEGSFVALGIDTGSAGTWLTTDLTSAWQEAHPDWPVSTGALGSTNFFGFDFEAEGTLTALPELRIGAVEARDVAVLGLSPGFFGWYSRKSAAPVAGFIGGNVLRNFRVEVDWPGRMTWWSPGPDRVGRDLDVVGLTVRPETDGGFTVARVVEQDDQPAVPGARAGDRLLRIGAMETAGASMGEVVDALRGRPGELRLLELERDGSTFTIEAQVRRFP